MCNPKYSMHALTRSATNNFVPNVPPKFDGLPKFQPMLDHRFYFKGLCKNKCATQSMYALTRRPTSNFVKNVPVQSDRLQKKSSQCWITGFIFKDVCKNQCATHDLYALTRSPTNKFVQNIPPKSDGLSLISMGFKKSDVPLKTHTHGLQKSAADTNSRSLMHACIHSCMPACMQDLFTHMSTPPGPSPTVAPAAVARCGSSSPKLQGASGGPSRFRRAQAPRRRRWPIALPATPGPKVPT